MVLEVMGRYAGWIALYAGRRRRRGRDPDPGNPVHLRQHLRQDPRAREPGQALHAGRGGGRRAGKGRRLRHLRRPGGQTARRASAASARSWPTEIGKRTGKETRACVLGHLQRGGSPRPSTACSAPCSARRPWNSSPRASSATWSPHGPPITVAVPTPSAASDRAARRRPGPHRPRPRHLAGRLIHPHTPLT